MRTNICLELPIETISEANTKEHWARKARRVKMQRSDTHNFCRATQGALKLVPESKLKIQLIRLAPKKLDSDNLVSSFKAIRDGVADWLKIDDGSDRIEWLYSQEPIKFTRAVRLLLWVDVLV